MTAPPAWSAKAVRLNGRDITDTSMPFGTKDDSLKDVEVVMAPRAARVVLTEGQKISVTLRLVVR